MTIFILYLIRILNIVLKYEITRIRLLPNVYTLHKKVTRTFAHNEYHSNTAGLFNRLIILKLNNMIAYNCFFNTADLLQSVILNPKCDVKYPYAMRSINTLFM